MKEQKSFQQIGGTLYLVPTPLGNLEDMTFRAVRLLQEVDFIAAEDTRQTRKLCSHFEIATPLVSYHEHNKQQAGAALLQRMHDGLQVALVSDAGMPGISDPGEDLVRLCLEEDLKVISLPGANAALTALVASGLPCDTFYFYGFLKRHKKIRQQQLETLSHLQQTLLFYEAPHRLAETLRAMYDVFGDRRVVIARELTKKFEEYQRGTLAEALTWCDVGTVKGEFCIVVEGYTGEVKEDESWWQSLTERQHVDHYIMLGKPQKDALKQVAKDRALPKREVYQRYHNDK
ncbi:16S rRNA (cytidine(1402)-2'-O)-methyltransferase [Bacillus sp. FSL W7-1360]